MPAAAVIPAPIAYIKVAAVKKLVVGFLADRTWPATVSCVSALFFRHPSNGYSSFFIEVVSGIGSFTLKKLECFKQALCYEYISME